MIKIRFVVLYKIKMDCHAYARNDGVEEILFDRTRLLCRFCFWCMIK